MRRLLLLTLACASLLTLVLVTSAQAQVNYRPRPYDKTVCAPALYPWTNYRACEEIRGQGQTVHAVKGWWMVREPIPGPLGFWSFTGYGAVVGPGWSTASALQRIHTANPNRFWWYIPMTSVERKVPWGSWICSEEIGGWPGVRTIVRALVCFKTPVKT